MVYLDCHAISSTGQQAHCGTLQLAASQRACIKHVQLAARVHGLTTTGLKRLAPRSHRNYGYTLCFQVRS